VPTNGALLRKPYRVMQDDNRIGASRSTVSRMLDQAREIGVAEIVVQLLPVFRPGFLQNTVPRGLLRGYGYKERLDCPDDHVTLILAYASSNEFPHQGRDVGRQLQPLPCIWPTHLFRQCAVLN